MSRAYARTIEPKTLTSRYDGENGRCSGSSPRDQPSAFSRCRLRFTTRSTFNATSSPAARFGPSGPRRRKLGRLRRPRLDGAFYQGLFVLTPVLVTKPLELSVAL